MDPLLQMSALELAQHIRLQTLSAVTVVSRHIEHISKTNPYLNALVVDRFARARQEALLSDTLVAEATASHTLHLLPPLLGVPCTIKESIAVNGFPNTAGSIHRKNLLADTDAPTVKKLKEAGAIILGVTNTSELCMWMESFNPVYGLTNNAYSEAHTAGGSSGGEGAIVGSGASPFGLGSDIGGSIRMPALFNGIFGHKGSPGLISNAGQYPQPDGIAQEMLATGPLCRRAEDLPLLLGILTGQPERFKSAASISIHQLRIIRRRPVLKPTADRAQETAIEQATQLLQEAGARVEYHDWPEFADAFTLWSNLLSSANSTSFAEMMYGSNSLVSAGKALGQLITQPEPPHTLPLILLSMLERLPGLFTQRRNHWVRKCELLRQKLTDILQDDGIILDLAYPTQAPKHYRAMLPPWGFTYAAIYNALRLPATQIPMGIRSGLPTGIQAIASPDNDQLGIAVALYLEERTGGWTPPWMVG